MIGHCSPKLMILSIENGGAWGEPYDMHTQFPQGNTVHDTQPSKLDDYVIRVMWFFEKQHYRPL
jgi:hypothetical protein